MPKAKKNSDTSEEENKQDDVKSTDEENTEETSDEENKNGETTEDEEDTDSSSSDDDLDLDDEIEKEKKRAPDQKKAAKAFKKREERREQDTGEDTDESEETGEESDDLSEEEQDEEERPLSRRETQKLIQESEARAVAKQFATSDKEAQLYFLKWKNRIFPSSLSVEDQMEEVVAITHKKRFIGQRNEALRALKNKGNVSRDVSSDHRDGTEGKEPKLSPADRSAVLAAGYVFNGVTRRFEKKLPNGDTLVWDIKTKKRTLVKKSK